MNPIFTKLNKDLKLTFAKGKNDKKIVVPAKFKSNGKTVPVDFHKYDNKGELDKIFNAWVSEVYDSPASFKNRFNRYTDLDFMYYNDSIASIAIDLLADETVQTDSDDQAILIESKDKKFEKEANQFLVDVGFTKQRLRSIAFDLGLYGDSVLINSVTSKEGVANTVPISVYSLKERLEFSLSRATEEYMKKSGSIYSMINKSKSFEDLYKLFMDTSEEDISHMFEEYLFGYKVSGDIALPPWSVTHFRRYSNRTEFWPFGQPAFMHMIAPFRQFNATLNLQAMARIASFPIKHFEVTVDENMTQIEKFTAINEARQEWANLGVTNTGKDEFSINDEVWTANGLINLKVLENRVDIDKIGDLNLLQDRMLVASRVPKGFIPIGNDNSWGSSGKSLVQQSKIFGRFVYTNQQAIISELINLVKMHFAVIGKYENVEFEISMPFPVVEEDSDKFRMKNDSLRLAKDILDNLGGAVGLDRDEALPLDVVEDIFSNYSFLDPDEVKKWIKVYSANKPIEESKLRESKLRHRYYENKELLNSTVWSNMLEENIGLHETNRNGRHYIYSKGYDTKSNQQMLKAYKSEKFVEALNNEIPKLNLQELREIPVKEKKKRKFTK